MEQVVEPVLKPASGGPAVVVDYGSESIEARALAWNNHVFSLVFQTCDSPLFRIELDFETTPLHHKIASLLVGEVLGSAAKILRFAQDDRGIAWDDGGKIHLILAGHISLLSPEHVLLQ